MKKTFFGDMTAWKKGWRKVSESVGRYLNEDQDEHMENIISLSYNKLPLYLRLCFLYLFMFPENFGIHVQKLILMWISERFIQPKR